MTLDANLFLRGAGLLALTTLLGATQPDRPAPEPLTPDYVVWPNATPPAGSPTKLQFKTHSWSLAHREKSGDVESHDTRNIVMIVQTGEATLICGNDVVDAKRPSPDELRGSSIRNGVSRKVVAGDVINMPAGLPHQFILEPGKQLTYIDVVIPAPKPAAN